MYRQSSTLTFKLLHAVWAALLMVTLQEGTAVGESICAIEPDLQVLDDDGIGPFHCAVEETLHALNCSHKGVPALPRSSDTAVPVGLEVFDFSHNKIKCVPKINNTRPSCRASDCHAGCLLELHLQHNEIEYLHDEAFQNLTCLTSLDLSHNLITNTTLNKRHFFRLVHLEHLDLHGNPLHTVPDNVIISTHLSHLKTLNLSSCQVEKVGELALDDFFELEVLDLSKNQLSWLSGRTFQALSSLRVLDLRWNRLEVIEKDTFGDMRQLQELRLDYNRLTSISEIAFHRWAAVDSLGLFQNLFTSLPVPALATLRKLRALDVGHNPVEVLSPADLNTTVQVLKMDYLTELTQVRDDAFSPFPHLTSLSLRFCRRLKTLSPHAFRKSSLRLREVALDHGGLQHLAKALLPWRQLRLLTLQDNDWHCDCRLGWAAGHPVGNSTIRCSEPPKLRGQSLDSLRESDLTCAVSIMNLQVIIALSLTSLFLATFTLALCRKRRRMLCWCLRGDQGRYVTIFTKTGDGEGDGEEGEEMVNGTCGEGEVDDLDLGNGQRGGGGEGRVRILVKSFRKGYSLLKNKGGESSQDLTKACDV